MMNVARNRSIHNPYEYKANISDKSKGAEVISLVRKQGMKDKKMTIEYLNEKLAYFYNNGGPIMDL
jgi:hypothetical protein